MLFQRDFDKIIEFAKKINVVKGVSKDVSKEDKLNDADKTNLIDIVSQYGYGKFGWTDKGHIQKVIDNKKNDFKKLVDGLKREAPEKYYNNDEVSEIIIGISLLEAIKNDKNKSKEDNDVVTSLAYKANLNPEDTKLLANKIKDNPRLTEALSVIKEFQATQKLANQATQKLTNQVTLGVIGGGLSALATLGCVSALGMGLVVAGPAVAVATVVAVVGVVANEENIMSDRKVTEFLRPANDVTRVVVSEFKKLFSRE